MRKPADSGSLWHNYKGFFSMVLMAICDARFCFTLIDVGEYGTNNDSGVLKNSQMGKMFQREEMNVPGPRDVEKETREKLESSPDKFSCPAVSAIVGGS